MRVAIVGTGRMGSAMARAIARGGAELVLKTAPSIRPGRWPSEIGANVAGTPREAAAGADVAITMLADGPAVTATWDGPDGLIAGASAGSVLVDMSTAPPETVRPSRPRFGSAVPECWTPPSPVASRSRSPRS